jgi:Tfp pilus assembly protein PilX
MNKNITTSYKRQSGAAVLVISVVLLLAVTLLVVYAARVGLLDQKISGNEYRHKVAFANAEAGMEQAASFLRANPALHDGNAADGWRSCAGLTTIFPCDIAGATQVFDTLLAVGVINSAVSTIAGTNGFLIQAAANTTTAVGSGVSDDGTGVAVVQVSYAKTALITPGNIPPIMAPTVDLSGNFTVVPDPNGGGPGVAVSAWVKTSVTSGGSGSWQTCNHGDFQDSGVCIDTKTDTEAWGVCNCIAGEQISDGTNINDDIVIDPTINFPASPFEYIFNGATQAEILARAEVKGKVVADCTSSTFGGPPATVPTTVDGILLSALDEPLVWVTGICDFPNNTIIGSRTTPIILVASGLLRATGNLDIFGIVVGLGDFQLNGGVVFHGSAISEDSTKLTNGSFKQVYDESVLNALADDTLTTDISKIKYSWRDF